MRWVGQEEPWGCGCAAVATLTGRTYAAVSAHVDRAFDGTTRGLSADDWLAVLAELGYAAARLHKVKHWPRENLQREPWPPTPFGDRHLCAVVTPGGGHMVAMRGDGTVLDPLTPEPRRLTDYATVYWVAAIVPLGGSGEEDECAS